ncbi:hypothetical protein AZE42_08110 [Rhizopogon vesiculosus]|uniref:Replication protein A C-terminal domain-containing protein n=1 Tax=Rhizopogon vesiculosus TaxID=180088 RepID=A0A1J8QAF1_9AGAM|nr:hypothetical protein AZE42_08110 [Rhizopogon vesiculosus]
MDSEDCDTSLVETTFIKPSETDSIRPITIYQMHRSERLNDDVEYTLDGVKFNKVLLVTHVILSVDTSDVRGNYQLEDGTGSIRGSLVNRVGQDPLLFSAMVRQFHGGLACVIGKLVQFGHRKSVDIEKMTVAGYHQAMFHMLECMKLSLTIERLARKPPAPDTEETDVAKELNREVLRTHDSIGVDSGTSNQPHYSFFDLPDNDQGGDVDPVQTGASLPQSYTDHTDHGEGSESSSESPARAAPRLPALLPAPEPETIHSTIIQVAGPHSVTRTPSPLSSFGSSLRIGSCFVPQHGQLAQLRATQLAIVSSLGQLQDNAPYGVWIADVFESVSQVIETTWEEFVTDIKWLLEEAYIVRLLDDDHIALTPRGSA